MLKQIFIINKDLGMRAGKIAAQCCHGEVLYMEEIVNLFVINPAIKIDDKRRTMLRNFNLWKEREIEPIDVMTKIVKKATYQELLEIIHTLDEIGNIKYYPVYDLGKTQVLSESLTCVCIEPLEEEVTDKLFGELKLL